MSSNVSARRLRRASISLCLLLFALPAGAQPAADPDWPCIQRLVPELSPALIWAGPPLEGAGDWRDDSEIVALVKRIAPRTTPIEDAVGAIETFAEGLVVERNRRLIRLFLGVFEAIDEERKAAIAAAKRFGRAQRRLLQSISDQTAALEAARATASPDTAEIERLTDSIYWNRRVFDDRRRATQAVCDQPVLMDERLGILARTIMAQIR